MEYRARYQGGVLRLLTNTKPDLDEGEVVLVDQERRVGQEELRDELLDVCRVGGHARPCISNGRKEAVGGVKFASLQPDKSGSGI